MKRPAKYQKVWLCVGIMMIWTWGQTVLAAPSTEAPAASDSEHIMEGHVDKTADGPQADAEADNRAELQARLSKGVKDFERHDYKNAELDFQNALSLEPSNADALYNLGALAERRGALREALKYYMLADCSKPNDADISGALASVQEKIVEQREVSDTPKRGFKFGASMGTAFAASVRAFAAGWAAVPNAPPPHVDTCGVCAPALGRRW